MKNSYSQSHQRINNTWLCIFLVFVLPRQRPFPLKGTYYANIFIHFEPIEQLNEEEDSNGHLTLPPYVLPGSPEAEHWKEDNPTGWSKVCDIEQVTGESIHPQRLFLDLDFLLKFDRFSSATFLRNTASLRNG